VRGAQGLPSQWTACPEAPTCLQYFHGLVMKTDCGCRPGTYLHNKLEGLAPVPLHTNLVTQWTGWECMPSACLRDRVWPGRPHAISLLDLTGIPFCNSYFHGNRNVTLQSERNGLRSCLPQVDEDTTSNMGHASVVKRVKTPSTPDLAGGGAPGTDSKALHHVAD